MKKIVLILSVAALALASCVKTSDVYTGSPDSRQITFSPLAQPSTKAAVRSEVFPTSYGMEVRAFQSAPSAAEYFAKTTFTYSSSSWHGSTARYWPLSLSTINFFALAGNGLDADDMTIADALASAQVKYAADASDNNSSIAYSQSTQSDIMYAFNRGSVTQSGNALSFNGGAAVPMQFKHALAVVNFQIKAADATSTAISIKKIELNGARYTGVLDITNSNANTENGTFSAQLDWTPDAAVDGVVVPNIGNVSSPVALTTSYAPVNDETTSSEGTDWAALMIIPKQQKASSPVEYGFTTFKITYVLNGREYEYTYAPSGYTSSTPNLTVVEAGKKYTYQISMQLHEITIAATVSQWDEQNSADNVSL